MIPVTVHDLDIVTRTVNQQMHYVSDMDHYGVADKWVMAPDDMKGDCEDYALTKMGRLHTMGVPLEDMRIVIVNKGEHAVLEVSLKGSLYILDMNDPYAERKE